MLPTATSKQQARSLGRAGVPHSQGHTGTLTTKGPKTSTLVATIHFSPFTCFFRRPLGAHSQFFFSDTKMPKGSRITPITFTDSLQSREQWPLRPRLTIKQIEDVRRMDAREPMAPQGERSTLEGEWKALFGISF